MCRFVSNSGNLRSTTYSENSSKIHCHTECQYYCFLISFFWKNRYVSERQRRIFCQKNILVVSWGKSLLNFLKLNVRASFQGEIARKFATFQILWKIQITHISWSKAPRGFLRAFLDFLYFLSFWTWNLWFFNHICFGKIAMFLMGWEAFQVINFCRLFPRRILLLNFRISDFWGELNCS